MATYKSADELIKAMEKRLTAGAKKSSKKVVTKATLLVQNTAKESVKKKGTGRVYRKYNPNRVHQASSPNNPPATDTGFLSANITMNIRTGHDGSVIGQVISAAPYSAALEFGTKDMLALGGPRPFMQPALEKNKNKIVKMFKDEGIFK